jgi:hypothetical protein
MIFACNFNHLRMETCKFGYDGASETAQAASHTFVQDFELSKAPDGQHVQHVKV